MRQPKGSPADNCDYDHQLKLAFHSQPINHFGDVEPPWSTTHQHGPCVYSLLMVTEPTPPGPSDAAASGSNEEDTVGAWLLWLPGLTNV